MREATTDKLASLKALTIIQPYAELIASGVKRVENRGWYMKHRGPLAIHAGKARRYGGEAVADIAADYLLDPARLTFGAIIAVADVIDCVMREDIERFRHVGVGLPASLHWVARHEHAEGPFCIVLANVRRLPEPIVIDGKQGLWNVPDAYLAGLRSRLAGMAEGRGE